KWRLISGTPWSVRPILSVNRSPPDGDRAIVGWSHPDKICLALGCLQRPYCPVKRERAFMETKSFSSKVVGLVLLQFLITAGAHAGEADINLPALDEVEFSTFGGLSGYAILYFGLLVCGIGAAFGLFQYAATKKLPVHSSMSDVSNIIWETCKTYLLQQGKFLFVLWILIAACIVYYFFGLQHKSFGAVAVILACSVLGILGSYGVAWFGIRINTVANSRAA